MSECKCVACVNAKRLSEIRDKLSPEDADWLKEFARDYLTVVTDASYYSLVMKGEWPDSVEILTRALDRVKKAKQVRSTEIEMDQAKPF
jgi:hypothetical protein